MHTKCTRKLKARGIVGDVIQQTHQKIVTCKLNTNYIKIDSLTSTSNNVAFVKSTLSIIGNGNPPAKITKNKNINLILLYSANDY